MRETGERAGNNLLLVIACTDLLDSGDFYNDGVSFGVLVCDARSVSRVFFYITRYKRKYTLL